MQFATRQRRLEHIAGIHRALGLARTHHGVDLVDEDDGLTFILSQFFQHRFQPFFELAAKLGTSQQARHVERQHALVLQRLGHFAIDDALCQTLDDGGLAHARLADQHRVVLGATLQDLNDAPDFIITADHRIELALARTLGQIEGVFLQRLALALGLGAVHRLAAAHRLDGLLQRAATATHFLEQAAGLAFVFGQRQQEHFRGNELIATLLRFAVSDVEQVAQIAPQLHLAAMPLDARQPLDGLGQRLFQARYGHASTRQQRGRRLILRQQRREQMQGLDVLLIASDGHALGIGQRLLQAGSEFIHSHDCGSVIRVCAAQCSG